MFFFLLVDFGFVEKKFSVRKLKKSKSMKKIIKDFWGEFQIPLKPGVH